jgi:hypothetical protein
MKILRTVVFCSLALVCATSALTPVQAAARSLALAKDKKALVPIVLVDDAIPAEQNAATQLKKYLEEMTGATFEIRTEAAVPEASPQILVGSGARAKKLLPGQKWDALGPDSIVVKTVGNKLVLAGDRPRGSLYACYTFLEDVLGCRWWSSNESTIPRRANLKIEALDKSYTPPVPIRELLYRDVFKSPELQTSLKLNGHYNYLPDEWGNNIHFVPDLVHTFFKLLPPGTYFEAHPDWYSELNGKRVATGEAQLCLTNPGMRAEMTRVLLEKLRADKNPRLVSLSQNDSFVGNCQCPNCKAIDEREGSPAGSLIDFVNAIATELEKEFPKVMVETLAYNYSRTPPRSIRPRKNVAIRIVGGVGCTYEHPLDSEYSETYRDQVKKWSAIAPNLMFWDYTTNFSNYLVPHPNMQVLAPNIRFFAKNHAWGIYEHGDSGSLSGDFVRLRAWLIAHLMWNPDLDETKLRREFLQGYYGAAAPYLNQYIDLISNTFVKRDLRLSSSGSQLAYLDLKGMNLASSYFDRAEKAVASNAIQLKRVRRERLPLEHLWILRYMDLKRLATQTKEPFNGPANVELAAQSFSQQVKDNEEGHGGMYSEGVMFQTYESKLRQFVDAQKTVSTPPKEVQGLPTEDWVDIQDYQFNLPGASSVNDETASDGKAVQPGGAWGIMAPISGDILELWDGEWDAYLSVRVVGKKKEEAAFGYGLYDYGTRDGSNITVYPDKISDESYQTYSLGTVKLNMNQTLWVSAVSADKILVDRLFLVKKRKPTP